MKEVVNTLLSPLGVRLVRVPRSLEPAPSTTAPSSPIKGEIPRRINIGSGAWSHPEWHNLDMPSEWYAPGQRDNIDLPINLMEMDRLPIEPGTIEAAYCSHVVEHLPDDRVMALFREVARVLAPGGIFRITCPDADLIVERFLARDDDFFSRFAFRRQYQPESLEQAFLHCFAAVRTLHHPHQGVQKLDDERVRSLFRDRPPAEALREITAGVTRETQNAYPACHLNWFNADKLGTMLREAGFASNWGSRYLQSRSPCMRDSGFFDVTQPWMSLYHEASP